MQLAGMPIEVYGGRKKNGYVLNQGAQTTGQGYRVAAGSMVDDYVSGYSTGTWQNSSSGGSAVAPSSGVPYVTLNTGTASASYGRMIHKSVSLTGLVSTSATILDLEFPYPGPEAGDSIQVILSSDGYTSKSLTLGFTFTRYLEGRVQLPYKPSDWTALNGEVFDGTTFTYIALKYIRGTGTSMGTVAKQCLVRGVYKNSTSRPKIILQWDAGYSGVWDNVKPLMDAAGLVGTVNITRSSIDTAGFMTTAQLQALHAAGWDMAIRNGPTHDTFPDLASLTAEMKSAVQWNRDRGLTRGSNHCIYPVGIMTTYTKPACQAAGILTGRTTVTRYLGSNVATPGLYTLPCLSMNGANYFTGYAKPFIDDCVAFGLGGIMYTHDVQASTPASGISTADMASIISYLAGLQSAGQIDLVTTSQWYNSLGSAGV